MKKRSREINPKKQTLITKLSQHSAPSLIKHLASCNSTVRHHSLRLLVSHLTPSEIVSDIDIKKLWKGLFYCLWHCDKAPAQSELINRLTDLIMIQPYQTNPSPTDLVSINRGFAVRYFEGFLVTMRREWSGIDHLRLDKFYLCIRRFVKAVFGLVGRRGWDLELLGEFVDVLELKGFLADDELLGNGVCYHVVGVFLDELRGCFVPVKKEVVDLLFRPFFRVMEKSLDRILIGKVRGLVFEELLRIGGELLDRKLNGGDEEDSYDDVAFVLITLKMGFASKFYEIGSSEECVQGNRKVVLKLHEGFSKLEKRFESSGIEIEIPDVVPEIDDEDEEEVPELIPIEGTKKNGEDSVSDANGEAEEGEDMLDEIEDINSIGESKSDGNVLSESVIANLQKQFENVAAELGSDDENDDDFSLSEAFLSVGNKPTIKKKKKKNKKAKSCDPQISVNEDDGGVNGIKSVDGSSKKKNKKRARSCDPQNSVNEGDEGVNGVKSVDGSSKKKNKKRAKSGDPQNSVNEDDGGVNGTKSVDGSSKKVRFSMKNNLVWKPHSPLPPQSLRIPPSVTPRGSALKKGLSPGPIREIPPAKKKLKKKKAKKMLMKSVPWR